MNMSSMYPNYQTGYTTKRLEITSNSGFEIVSMINLTCIYNNTGIPSDEM